MTRRLFLAALLTLTIAVPVAAWFDDDEVIFYSTYGYKDGADWLIPMRAKVQEPRSIAGFLTTVFRGLPTGTAAETDRFRDRMADFIADDQSREHVRLQFDSDPALTEYRIGDGSTFPRTNGDGIVQGELRLTDAVAQRLLKQQASTNGWLSFRAVSSGHAGTGRVRLIGPDGVSVISDIDDTIKVTEIPAGKAIIATNTFFRQFTPTTELDARYKELGDAAFHYVSGGPWQLYRPLSKFISGRFPEGSFHMRSVNMDIRTPVTSVEGLVKFIPSEDTVDHKVTEIGRIMSRFKGRKFVLIGDSGEMDPEVYSTIRERFGAQIQAIVIRDLTNARTLKPARLDRMTVVAAPTVEKGISTVPR